MDDFLKKLSQEVEKIFRARLAERQFQDENFKKMLTKFCFKIQ
jgi:hypothetical protein